MARGATAMSAEAWAMRAATLLLMVVYYVAAQETCTSVTVTGGDFPGVYEQGTDSSAGGFVGTGDGSAQVLQAVTFGASRARRNLGGGGRRRSLANDCATQMWILTDTSTVTDEGFPYYSTFDCADHPADVESTWLKVTCVDCSEVAPISVVCTADATDDSILGSGDGGGGDEALALPAIIGIAAGGLVLLLCLGFCFSRHKKRAHKGSHTFADDSEHSMAQQKNAAAGYAAGGGAAVSGGAPTDSSVNDSRGPLPAYSAAVGETVESPLGPSGGGSGGLGLISKGANAKSFKPTQGPTNPAYEGIFATRSSAGGGGGSQAGHSASTMAHPPAVEMRAKFGSPEMGRKDSMAAAAAAAAASASVASRSQGGSGMHDVDMNSPGGFGNVLSSGVVDGRSRGTPPQEQPRQRQQPPGSGAGDTGGITWSAGQNLNNNRHRRGGYPASDFGGDSAAGSVYELQPPDYDEELEHTYHDDGREDSVAASSPGAYSMYSHYTAGGGMYGAGPGDTWSSDEGSGLRPDDRVGGVGGRGGGTVPQGATAIPSPATLGARNGPGGNPPDAAGSSRR
eukprot:g8010.t1